MRTESSQERIEAACGAVERLPAVAFCRSVRASGRRSLRAPRRGITLIEVMLATVMLLASVMALSRVAFLARRHATAAEDRSRTQMYCQNIMQEILAGVRPLQGVAPQVFEGDQWVYMIEVETIEQSTLSAVTVTVDRLDDPEGGVPTEDELGGYRLVRWIRASQQFTDEFGDEVNDGVEPETPGSSFDD